MYIIAGLGNPTKQYEGTRHNAGFFVVDLLAARHGVAFKKAAHKAAVGEGSVAGCRVLFLKPSTYMNLSGESIASAVRYYKTDPRASLIVVYDDIDLPVGEIRVRQSGSAGTHNGMRSVIAMLGTDDFARVRVGIGKPEEGRDLAGYVLGKIPQEQERPLAEAAARAADAIEMILAQGLPAAQQAHNHKSKPVEN